MTITRNLLLVFAVLALGYGCSDDRGLDSVGDAADGSPSESDAADIREDTTADADDASDTLDAGRWEELAPIEAGAQQETAVLALDGKIYVIGGFDASVRLLDRVSVYDPQTDTWSQAAPVPTPMHHANAAVVDSKIYVVGFLTGGFTADGRVFVFDPQSDSWSEGQSMPDERIRGSSATVAIGAKIYVAGGLRNGAVADFSVYDPQDDTWSTLADIPRSVDHAAFGAIDGRLIVAGGRDSNIGAHIDRVDIYDPQAQQWESGAAMPTSRGGTASAVLDGKLYVFGGEGNPDEATGVFDDVEAYDAQTDSWQVLDAMPDPRHGMGAASTGGHIFVPGGAPRRGFGAVDTHSVFTP